MKITAALVCVFALVGCSVAEHNQSPDERPWGIIMTYKNEKCMKSQRILEPGQHSDSSYFRATIGCHDLGRLASMRSMRFTFPDSKELNGCSVTAYSEQGCRGDAIYGEPEPFSRHELVRLRSHADSDPVGGVKDQQACVEIPNAHSVLVGGCDDDS